MKYKSNIIVKLKKNVRDTKGQALTQTIERIEYAKNVEARTGSYYEIVFEAKDDKDAQNIVSKIAKDILSNPIIEEYQIIETKKA